MNKKGKLRKIGIIFISLLVLTLGFVIASVVLTPTTEPTGSTTSNPILINYSVSTDYLNNGTWDWSGLITTIYDYTTQVLINFNNNSLIPCGTGYENDTCAADLSMYKRNATITGGSNVSLIPNGRYEGAINFSKNVSYATLSSIPNISKSNNFTIYFWFNLNSLNHNIRLFSSAKTTNDRFMIGMGGSDYYLKACFADASNTYYGRQSGSQLVANQWYFFTYSFNNETLTSQMTINGVPQTAVNDLGGSSSNAVARIGASNTAVPTVFSDAVIDDFAVENVTLSLNQVNEKYYSSLEEHNPGVWWFISNHTFPFSLNPANYSYQICYANLTSQVCSTNNTLTKEGTVNVVTANFTTIKGMIRSDFYGTNTHGVYGANNTMLDTNNDGVGDTLSDYNWERQALLNAGIKEMRADMYLESRSVSDGVFTGMAGQINLVEWAAQNNIKILYITGSTPTWLQNRTTGWCKSTKWETCSATDYDLLGKAVVDFLNIVTQNGKYASTVELEVWNEPNFANFLLNNISADNDTTSAVYNLIYNATWNAVKAVYPNMIVGSPSVTTNALLGKIDSGFLGNFSSQMDYMSFHHYRDTYVFPSDLGIVILKCANYSANCSIIKISEWNTDGDTVGAIMKNSTDISNFTGYMVQNYMDLLNLYPSNISSSIYQWSETSKYIDSHFPEFPQDWRMVVEPNLLLAGESSYKPSYNVTSDLSNLCPVTGYVAISSADDINLKTLICKKGLEYSVSIFNKGVNPLNVSINLSLPNGTVPYPYPNITDFKTRVVYNLVNGYTNLGLLNNNTVIYLTSNTTPADITPPVFTSIPANSSLFYGNQSLGVNFDANDETRFGYYSVNDTRFTISDLGFLTNNTIMDIGNYEINVTINDSSNNINWTRYKVQINDSSISYNVIDYETASSVFIYTIPSPSYIPTNAYLIYNGTSYSAAITSLGSDYLLTNTLQIPSSFMGTNNFTYEWNTSTTTKNDSYLYRQTINPIQFGLCNGTLLVPYLNLTFKDESTDEWINATIPYSTFIYYLGDGSQTKTLIYMNNVLNYNFTFCASGDRVYHINSNIQYMSGVNYPSRIWNPDVTTYSSILTNQTLYLLNAYYGIYTTFQVVNTAGQSLSGVEIIASRAVNGVDTVVASGTTSSTGSVTFWLNPSYVHTITFSKTGFDTFTFNEPPTQSSYTITLAATAGSGSGGNVDYREGVTISKTPLNETLDENSIHDFTFTINSTYHSLVNFAASLYFSNGTLVSTESGTTTSGGTLTFASVNVSNQSAIYMKYNYSINSTVVKGNYYWIITGTGGRNFSISHFIDDFKSYTSDSNGGLFGIDNFGRGLICIVFLFLVCGGLGYRYGIQSEPMILGIIFGVVLFLDTMDFLPPFDIAGIVPLDHFISIITGFILLGFILKEELQ